MDALLVSNPIATSVTPQRQRVVQQALASALDLEVAATRERGHARSLALEAVAGGAKAIVVYGGDGTVNEVLDGMLDGAASTHVRLGILPGGGTNVLARNVGFPLDIVEAAGRLLECVETGRTRTINVGRLTASGTGGRAERVFALGCGLVLDAETVRDVEQSGLRPRLGDYAFLYYGLRAFRRLRSEGDPALRVTTPAGEVAAWWTCVVNADPYTYWGGRGLRVAPMARYERGLSLVAGRTAQYLKTSRWLAGAIRSPRHVDDADCLHMADRAEVEVRAVRPVSLQADGDFLDGVEHLHARSLAGAVGIYA